MGKTKASQPQKTVRKIRPALSPEARENQLVSLAVDLAEKQPKCPIFFNIFLYYIIIFSVLVFRSMPRLYLHTNHLVYSNLNTFFLLYHLKWD